MDDIVRRSSTGHVTATDLIAYCRGLGIPFGFNVESVSIRRDEIDASIGLAADLGKLLRRYGEHDSTRASRVFHEVNGHEGNHWWATT